MRRVAIQARGISKQYAIGASAQRQDMLRETLVQAITSPWRHVKQRRVSLHPTFMALSDVSFDIRHGEVVGVIGRNGAGKSTLLKILCRITRPTSGYAEIFGRIGSLLEVGTGFHPELSGRENIYLNGAILGMAHRDIARRFEEIVSFADVERFIDTPVKHYSSGMYMRLAFAVASHLEPEVLLVDEVLAVGDVLFQKRCLAKMETVANEGRTVLFVSHNLGAVSQICDQAMILNDGRLQDIGPVEGVVAAYLASMVEGTGWERKFSEDPAKPVQIRSIGLRNSDGIGSTTFTTDQAVYVSLEYQVHRPIVGANIALGLARNGAEILTTFDTDEHTSYLERRNPGYYAYQIKLPVSILKAGLYSLHVGTGAISKQPYELHSQVLSFRLEEASENTSLKGYAEHRRGFLRLPLAWEKADAMGNHP